MGSRGVSSKSAAGTTLDKALISRANGASALGNAGEIINKTFQNNVAEINNLQISDKEKQKAIREQQELATKALKTTSDNANPFATGRANRKIDKKGADKIAKANNNISQHMNKIRQQSENNERSKKQANRAKLVQDALKRGALSVVIDGETWTRKTTRSKTFTRSY